MAVESSAAEVDLSDLGPFLAGREHALFQTLREHDPLHWDAERGGPGFWSLTRYADVRTVLEDPVTYANGQGTQIPSRRVEGRTPTVHNTDPPRHTALRRVATPYLRAVEVRRWQELIETAVTQVLDDLVEQGGRGEVELVRAASAVLPIQVLGQVLGVPAQDCPLLAGWTDRVISDDPEFMRGPDEKEQAREELFAYFRDLTAARRAEPRDDLVSRLVEERIDGEPLSWADLAAYYFVLVGAGNETTRNLLTGAVLAFAAAPGEWERLRADHALLQPAIEELLRFVTPPIRAMRRTATRDVAWHGRTVHRGDKVVLWFQAANRDPAVFDDPDTLRVDRHPNPHLGFGRGIHFCLGAHLARAEVAAFLRQVLERDLSITPVAEPERLRTNQFHAFKRLRVSVARLPGDRSLDRSSRGRGKVGEHERFLAVHTLKVKGLASAEVLADVTGTDLGPVLDELTAEELVKLRTGRVSGYLLTKTGREAHPALLAAAVTDAERTGAERTYAGFLPVNGRFKEVCTRWQVRGGDTGGGGEPNDHSDPDYDADVLDELERVHRDVVAALGPVADASSRFGRYQVRFEAALAKVRGGDIAAFARPMSGSYHDVWMELHQDLVLTLGRERGAEDGA